MTKTIDPRGEMCCLNFGINEKCNDGVTIGRDCDTVACASQQLHDS